MESRNCLLKTVLVAILCLLSCSVRDAYPSPGPLQIETVYLEDILPSRYRYYTQEPLGRVRIRNTSNKALYRIKVSLFIPNYMSLSEEYEIAEIMAKSTVEIPLKATLSPKIFDVDEDTAAQVQIRITGEGIEESCIRSITMLSRNTIDWRQGENITSFVTPNDSAILEFTKLCLPSFRDTGLDVLDNRLQDAMAIYATLGSVTYLPDPNMPYKKIAEKKVVMDKVQYPRETLKYKNGDCDDLSVLYASCLEAVGIKTAFVLVPGHIFVIFNTRLPSRNREVLGYDETSYIVRDNYIWLPVEVTRFGDSFVSAIKEGILEYKRWLSNLEIIDVQKGWQRFAPVALPPVAFPWKGDKELAEKRLKEEIATFKGFKKESLDSLITTLSKKIKESPYNLGFRNRAGIIYGKEGRWDLAEREFEKGFEKNKLHPSILNNLGNICLLRGSSTEAISFFKQANRSDPDDGGIYFNLGLAFFLKEDMRSALEMLGESLKAFRSFEEAAYILGFPVEEVSISLTGKPRVSKEEIKRLLEDAMDKIPEGEEAKKRAKKTFGFFAGTRGAEISKKTDLSWLLYWKE
ncbi:MAG: tetratricopeptide repeat protein [bacterium]